MKLAEARAPRTRLRARTAKSVDAFMFEYISTAKSDNTAKREPIIYRLPGPRRRSRALRPPAPVERKHKLARPARPKKLPDNGLIF
ncbi:hypothetical protein EVAR_31172_1 [Eumeta japonica]|uniref:Uncharacterized protein n=1 Tax=Eumeta variegata TaxID=151549 RepID=A0A4C1VVU5_EUMVA|nr:hypothetical protein EVAR_31172_1 [Eumeta japonica]